MNGITSKKSSTGSEPGGIRLSRNTKKEVRLYLILVVLLIPYNVTTCLFPDAGFFMPVYYQNLYASISGMLVTLYFVFYLYKAFYAGMRLVEKHPMYGMSGIHFYRKNWALAIAPVFLPGLFMYMDRFSGALLVNTACLVVTVTFVKSMAHKTIQHFVRKRTIHLERANQEETKAFMVLIHELKTPVMLSQNYILDYEKKYGSNQELETIKSSTNKIARTLAGYTDLEKVHRGMRVYRNEKIIDFSRALTTAVRLFSSAASRKDIRIASTIESDLLIKCDPVAVDRIINNIIENSIKYTERNKRIRIKLASNGPRFIFTVSDEGIGIPQEKQAFIFDYYRRAHTKQQSQEGMGLGLPIVKQAVESLNGKIRVHSAPGKGSCFTIILPAHNLSVKETVFTPVISNSSCIETVSVPDDVIISGERPSIMIVEDDLPLLKLLRDKLSPFYNVFLAKDGTYALQKLKQRIRIDLIVSDIMMENGDGFALYEQTVARKEYGHLPFIFLTASTDVRIRARGLQTGAVGYMEKPFKVKLLKEKIDAILALMERQRTAIIHQAYYNLNRETFLPARACFDANCDKYGFTSREKEISKLLKQGITYPAIGEELYIATNTVKKHVSHIFEKAGVKSKLQLIKVLEARG